MKRSEANLIIGFSVFPSPKGGSLSFFAAFCGSPGTQVGGGRKVFYRAGVSPFCCPFLLPVTSTEVPLENIKLREVAVHVDASMHLTAAFGS